MSSKPGKTFRWSSLECGSVKDAPSGECKLIYGPLPETGQNTQDLKDKQHLPLRYLWWSRTINETMIDANKWLNAQIKSILAPKTSLIRDEWVIMSPSEGKKPNGNINHLGLIFLKGSSVYIPPAWFFHHLHMLRRRWQLLLPHPHPHPIVFRSSSGP